MGRSPVNFQVTPGICRSMLSPQRAFGRRARVLEARLSLNTDLQEPVGELVLSGATVLNYYLKSDRVTSHGPQAWQEKPWAHRSELWAQLQKASPETIQQDVDVAV